MDLARRAGIARLVINGSFTTDAHEPNDVDCVLLVPDGLSLEDEVDDELESGLPYLSIEVVSAPDFSWLVDEMFASDRDLVPKGVIEVIL